MSIVTEHLHKQSKLKVKALKNEYELEKIKQENFILETEKIRLEIAQTRQQLTLEPKPFEVKQTNDGNN